MCVRVCLALPNRTIRMAQIPPRIENIPHARFEDFNLYIIPRQFSREHRNILCYNGDIKGIRTNQEIHHPSSGPILLFLFLLGHLVLGYGLDSGLDCDPVLG